VKQISIVLFLLVVLRPVFACDTPHGLAVATPQTVTACEYLDAAIGLNEQSALGIFGWTSFGFGTTSGAITAAPITLNGNYTKLQSTIDGLIASPAVATDGTEFLLVEYASGTTATRLMHADGTANARNVIISATNGNSAGATINSTGGNAAVVWDGNEYLVLTTEFVRPAADVNAVPKVVSIIVHRDGSVGTSGVIADNALLLTAVRSGSSAVAIWRRNGVLEAGPAVPQSINTGSYITLPISDASGAAAANNGAAIAVVFATNAGVQLLNADSGFGGRNAKSVNNLTAAGLEIVPDGNDFLVLQSDPGLNARATRISGGNPGATFALASGGVVGAASNSSGTIVAATHGCGTIASQFIARGATTASAATDLTLKASPQTDARLIPTNNGHQLFYLENHILYTQFISNAGAASSRSSLTSYATGYTATPANGGSAIAWLDGSSSNLLKVARFDQNGAKRGSTIDVPATATINAASIAATGDSLLVAFQGTPSGSHHPEVHAALIDTSGNVTQNVLLSSDSDDGSNVTAGVNGNQWMIAWRNGPPQVLVVISAPVTDLHSPTAKNISLPTIGLPMLAAADAGNVYWIERADLNFVHKMVVSTSSDSVIGQSADSIDTVRVANGIPAWSIRGATTGETTSVFQTPFGILGCFTAFDSAVDYDTKGNALSLYVYSDLTQLNIEVPSANTTPTRHRSVKH
jgi:hypothetical protein